MVNEPRSAGMGGLGRASGDLEAALAALEPVDVDGLSLDVSQDVFGRWCDACSRLAQTTGAWLVRYAPAQGRGLILLKDPAHPHELQVFSPLGMGSDYPQGVTITHSWTSRGVATLPRASGLRRPPSSCGGLGSSGRRLPSR